MSILLSYYLRHTTYSSYPTRAQRVPFSLLSSSTIFGLPRPLHITYRQTALPPFPIHRGPVDPAPILSRTCAYLLSLHLVSDSFYLLAFCHPWDTNTAFIHIPGCRFHCLSYLTIFILLTTFVSFCPPFFYCFQLLHLYSSDVFLLLPPSCQSLLVSSCIYPILSHVHQQS